MIGGAVWLLCLPFVARADFSSDIDADALQHVQDAMQEFSMFRVTNVTRDLMNSRHSRRLADRLQSAAIADMEEPSNDFGRGERLAGLLSKCAGRVPGWTAIPPFNVRPVEVGLGVLFLYGARNVTLTLSPTVAERICISDIFANSDQVLAETHFPRCAVGTSLTVNFRVVPMRVGKSDFKIYIGYETDGGQCGVTALEGGFTVNQGRPFELWSSVAPARADANATGYAYFCLRNNSGRAISVRPKVVSQTELNVKFPSEFNRFELANAKLETGESELDLIAGNATRALLELRLPPKTTEPSAHSVLLQLEIGALTLYYHIFLPLSRSRRFWQQSSLSLGVLVSRGVFLAAPIYALNASARPISLRSVTARLEGEGFTARAAMRARQRFFPAAVGERTVLLILFISYGGRAKSAVARGAFEATFTCDGQTYKEEIAFAAFFLESLLGVRSDAPASLNRETVISLKNKAAIPLSIERVEVIGSKANERIEFVAESRDRVRPPKNERSVSILGEKRGVWAPHESRAIIALKAGEDIGDSDIARYDFLFRVFALETAFVARVRMFKEVLACAVGSRAAVFKTCKMGVKVAFSPFYDFSAPQTRVLFLQNKSGRKYRFNALRLSAAPSDFLLKVAFVVRGAELAVAELSSAAPRVATDFEVLSGAAVSVRLTAAFAAESEGELAAMRELRPTLSFGDGAEGFAVTLRVRRKRGSLRVFPQKIAFSAHFPSDLPTYSLSVTSTFGEKVSLKSVRRYGRGRELLRIISVQRSVRAGRTADFLRFSVDPTMLLNSADRRFLARAPTATVPTRNCVERAQLSANVAAMLARRKLARVRARVVLRTRYGERITISVRGTVRVGGVALDGNDLGAVTMGEPLARALTLRNALDAPVAFSLSFAPRAALALAAIDAALPVARGFGAVMCVRSAQLDREQLRYVIGVLAPRKAQFAAHPFGAGDAHSLCFRAPIDADERRSLRKRILGIKVAKFKMEIFDEERQRRAIVRERNFPLSFVGEYSRASPYRRDFADRIFRLFAKFRKVFSEIPPFESELKTFEREIFFGKSVYNKTIVVAPKSVYRIADALLVKATAVGHESVILLSNNATGLLTYNVAFTRIATPFSLLAPNPRLVTCRPTSARDSEGATRPRTLRVQLRSAAPVPFRVEGCELEHRGESCLSVLGCRVGTVAPGALFTLELGFLPCRRLIGTFRVPANVRTSAGDFSFTVQIDPSGFHLRRKVCGAEHFALNFVFAFWAVFFAYRLFFPIASSPALLTRRRRAPVFCSDLGRALGSCARKASLDADEERFGLEAMRGNVDLSEIASAQREESAWESREAPTLKRELSLISLDGLGAEGETREARQRLLADALPADDWERSFGAPGDVSQTLKANETDYTNSPSPFGDAFASPTDFDRFAALVEGVSRSISKNGN